VAVVVMPQTVPQILRCLTLGRYAARVVDGRLQTSGPQPLAGPLPTSIKVRRDELVDFLNEYAGGVWPPAAGSGLREVEDFLDCRLAVALDVVEAAQRRAA
jgi:hypothetical protein